MRFLVNRDHTYTQGFAHTDPPEMYNTMPDAIIIKRGMYLQVELGPEETKITMPDGTKHSVSTSTFYWTVGSGCFNVDVTFKERPW